MKKKISLKLFFTVLWRGVCQVSQSIAKLFGYREGTTFGKVIWRICATCFTLWLSVFTLVVGYYFIDEVVYREWLRPYINTSERVYKSTHLSNHIVFQDLYYTDKGQIYDNIKDKVVLKDVDWVFVSEDKDSLAVFAQNGKRGYLNRFTGEVVLPAVYTKAWIFSEGLAAVEKDHKLMFIDRKGEIVIDNNLEVYFDNPQYAFHNGYCIVRNATDGKSGLIDRQGNWALQPEYDGIWLQHGLWKVNQEGLYGLFTEKLDTIMVQSSGIYIDSDVIEIHFPDNTAKRFDHQGNVLVDFMIDEVENILYETTDLRNHVNEEGYASTHTIYDVAKCQRYTVRDGNYNAHYGLMDRNGKHITPPAYSSIEAIAKDLYLCQPQGIIIDGSGKVVGQSETPVVKQKFHAHNFVSLNKKNGISVTPLN